MSSLCSPIPLVEYYVDRVTRSDMLPYKGIVSVKETVKKMLVDYHLLKTPKSQIKLMNAMCVYISVNKDWLNLFENNKFKENLRAFLFKLYRTENLRSHLILYSNYFNSPDSPHYDYSRLMENWYYIIFEESINV